MEWVYDDVYLYLLARVEEETLKKVVLHSVATALASMVLPVPGGPNMSTPCRQPPTVYVRHTVSQTHRLIEKLRHCAFWRRVQTVGFPIRQTGR